MGAAPETALAHFYKAISELSKVLPDFKARAYFARGDEKCYTGESIDGLRFFPAWLHDEKEQFIQDILLELDKADLSPQVSHYAFCTNGSHYAGEAGIPTIGYGPSRENLAHTTDEYIEICQLEKGVRGYCAILSALLTPHKA